MSRLRRYPEDADFEDIMEQRRGNPVDALDRAERAYERQFVPTAEDVGAEAVYG